MNKSKDSDKLKIEALFDSPKYGKVACAIFISDTIAIARFSDYRLAKDLYSEEKKQGNINQKLNERLKCLIESYPNKSKEEIAKEIISKFEEHNVSFKQ